MLLNEKISIHSLFNILATFSLHKVSDTIKCITLHARIQNKVLFARGLQGLFSVTLPCESFHGCADLPHDSL